MKFTNFSLIDPIMSIGIAGFILINAINNLKEVIYLFLEKVPCGISIEEIKEHILQINGIVDVHHIHIWSIDGQNTYATMHVVTNESTHEIKEMVREELKEHGIIHATLELETEGEECEEHECIIYTSRSEHHHHHHH